MRKSRETEWGFKGEITAFSALIFVLVISIVGALVESASIQVARSMKRSATRLALESFFAEYHVEMLKKYDLFVRVTGNEKVVQKRLQYYGANGVEHTLEKEQLLTDHRGKPFFEQAVLYARDWIGLEDTSFADILFETDIEHQENSILKKLEDVLDTKENPLQFVQDLKNRGVLTLVLPKGSSASDRKVNQQELPSVRELHSGNYGEEKESDITDKMLFVMYLAEHFSNFRKNDESNTLFYEQEYLIGGETSDRSNLEQVCQEILRIRTAVNYAYLCIDTAKKEEAEIMATGICGLILAPEFVPIVQQGLLLGWAYGESIVDVRVLLSGKKIPLVKTADSWQLQLSNLSKLGTVEEIVEEKGGKKGLGYEDYLHSLLAMQPTETLCMRGLDLIESNLHIKVDDCVTKAMVKSTINLRGRVREEFKTQYGYF